MVQFFDLMLLDPLIGPRSPATSIQIRPVGLERAVSNTPYDLSPDLLDVRPAAQNVGVAIRFRRMRSFSETRSLRPT